MGAIWILGLFVLLSIFNLVLSDSFPECGSCWCIPDQDGLDPCPTDWQPQTDFNTSVINVYKSQKPLQIYSLSCNPYVDMNCTTSPPQIFLDEESAVCAYKYSKSPNSQSTCTFYEMVTYTSTEEALNDNAILTHSGSCGVCSTTQDLAIYLTEDFTAAGKKCATIGLFDEQAGLKCYMDIGLTRECAKIWNYDGIYDGKACGAVCMKDLKEPNNGPPPTCTLNDCLQCDEEKAGPIFSSFAGRTRRRSGLRSEIVRSCSSISHIDHNPCVDPTCGC